MSTANPHLITNFIIYDMITAKYFKEEEFQKCSPSCSLQDMQQSTMDMLDKARELAGIPFVLNSAYRSIEHEKKQGRDGKSAHTLGCAVDLRCNSDCNRWRMIRALIAAGFTRIGVYKPWIHADNSPSHTQNVMWHG